MTGRWVSVVVAGAIALPLIAVSQFIAHLNSAVLDDQLFGYYGWRISEGATLYRDVWDHKPPGTFWINALGFWLTDGSYGGVIALCIAAQIVTLILIYLTSRQLYRPTTAAIIVVLAAVYLTHSRFFGGGNRSETYLIACQMGFVAFYFSGWVRERRWCWLGAGLCGGAAFLMKQNGITVVAAAMCHLGILSMHGRVTAQSGVRRAFLLLVGVIGMIAIAMFVLLSQGVLVEAWRAVVTANRVYLSIEPTNTGDAAWWWVRIERSELALLELPLFLAIAATLRSIAIQMNRSNSKCETHSEAAASGCPYQLSFLGFWIFFEVICAVWAPLPSSHYMLPLITPLLFLGGAFINAFISEAGLLDTVRRRTLTTLSLVLAAYFGGEAVLMQLQKASVVYWERKVRFESWRIIIEPTAAERVGREIHADTEPEESIQCWDYLPGVCLAARRTLASRFPDHLRAEWAARAGIASASEFAESIRSKSPAYVVIRSNSQRDLGSAAMDASNSFSGAPRIIEENYSPLPEKTIEGISVMGRRIDQSRSQR